MGVSPSGALTLGGIDTMLTIARQTFLRRDRRTRNH
jgi:hypothetical protein